MQNATFTGSIKARILGILGILAVGYLLPLAMVQFTAQATHRHLDQVSSTVFPAAMKMQQAEASFEQLKKRYKDAVLLEDPAALEAADREGEAVATRLANLRHDVAALPALAARVDDLSAQFASVRDRSHRTYGAMLASKDNLTDSLQAQVAELARDDRTLTAAMQALDASLAEESRREFVAINWWTARSGELGWIMLVVAMVGFAGACWVLQTKVFRPLGELANRMQAIAEGDGDLTDRVEIHGSNELDEVGRWFNVFIERVEQIVVRVTQNALALSEAATDLGAIAHETASQSTLQQTQAMRITASMGAISTAVQQISHTTQSAAQDARRAEQNAHSGGQTIQSTVATIQQLLVANQATATKIEELGHASDAIGRIIHVIDDIANQTSLLALNASIESARAGEHGRGFAVVAGEVRRLAERTSKATREIDQTVRAIQGGTAEVVEAMRSSMTHVQTGVTSARSAGDALASIIEGSEAVQRMVTQIASASTEQSAATQSVNANLNEISTILERSTGNSARAVDACDRLGRLAADLNQLVGRFKVRRAPDGIQGTVPRDLTSLPAPPRTTPGRPQPRLWPPTTHRIPA
jgi:methyl-accepting chemotaxis protein